MCVDIHLESILEYTLHLLSVYTKDFYFLITSHIDAAPRQSMIPLRWNYNEPSLGELQIARFARWPSRQIFFC